MADGEDLDQNRDNGGNVLGLGLNDRNVNDAEPIRILNQNREERGVGLGLWPNVRNVNAEEPNRGLNLNRDNARVRLGIGPNNGNANDANPNLVLNQDMNNFLRAIGGVNGRVPLHEALNILRKYDGKSDVNEYLLRLVRDLQYLNYNVEWALDNFDRLLTGDAKAWWSSRSVYYLNRLEEMRGNGLAVERLWDRMVEEMIKFFDKKSQRVANRVKNRQTTYNKGHDPQEYVTKKLAVLRLIDDEMKNDVIVEQLIKGLPYDLREKMSVLDIEAPEDFLKLLRRFNECYLDENIRSHNVPSRSEGSASTSYSPVCRRNHNFHSDSHKLIIILFLLRVFQLLRVVTHLSLM